MHSEPHSALRQLIHDSKKMRDLLLQKGILSEELPVVQELNHVLKEIEASEAPSPGQHSSQNS
ncbi:MAG: hypothetical protein MRZ79_00030 [Bacteroidia bacterium]|nr:hypothetical protein [Bacteroidia bacterium]